MTKLEELLTELSQKVEELKPTKLMVTEEGIAHAKKVLPKKIFNNIMKEIKGNNPQTLSLSDDNSSTSK